MIRRLLLALGLAGALVFTVPSAAQAVGWSGQRCHNGSDGWHSCTQVHTVSAAGGKVWVDTVQLCFTSNDSAHRGTFQNGFGGALWGGLPDTSRNVCVYAYPSKAAGTVGTGACYTASGRVNVAVYADYDWHTGGRVLGGAC